MDSFYFVYCRIYFRTRTQDRRASRHSQFTMKTSDALVNVIFYYIIFQYTKDIVAIPRTDFEKLYLDVHFELLLSDTLRDRKLNPDICSEAVCTDEIRVGKY